MASLLQPDEEERVPKKGGLKRKRRELPGDPDDFRLTLVEHLEELRDRIVRSLVIIAITWTIGWFIMPTLYAYLDAVVEHAIRPIDPTYKEAFRNVTEAFMLKFRLSFMIGMVLAFPFLVLELWGFIAPALKPEEQKPFKALAPFSVLLFALGAGFSWVILPSALSWFASYLTEFVGTTLIQDAGSMVFFILKMMLAFGIGFQLPLVVYILGALELLTAETMLQYWRQAATIIFIAAAAFTPSNDAFSMLMMAIPLVVLFAISVYMVKFTQGRKKKREEAARIL